MVGVTAWCWVSGLGAQALATHPFGTEDAGTVGAGTAEVELATALDAQGARVDGIGVSVVLHVGLADALDVGTELSFAAAPGADGGWGSAMGAPLIDAKWRLREPDGPAPGVAVKVAWAPPLSADGPAAGHGLVGVLAATWAAGATAIEANLGVTGCAGAEAATATAFQAAVGASVELSELVHAGVDAVLSMAVGESLGLDMMAGALFHVAPDRVVSVGVGVGVHDEATAWVASAALTATFGSGSAP
ncbi:MAG: hypothetical protein CVU56_24255 [Deltaproteobacteria bacterium HGW-Deltaproteobacteria-14]|nr:MAG: hypothetical protein CVU56_24255 [Deltaproteobacteria bacterium HGW-Deltaproteobacteria-14]